MPQGMPKIDQEIEKICQKLAPESEEMRLELDFQLHGFAILVMREFRKMMAEDSEYSPEEVKHG